MKANYSARPAVLQNQNNGSWLYNYDITSSSITDPQTGEEREDWECSQVVIWGEVTKKKAKAAVIASEVSPEDEKKLINDYNAFKESVLTDEKYKQNYLDFLLRRKDLKDMVNNESLIEVIE